MGSNESIQHKQKNIKSGEAVGEPRQLDSDRGGCDACAGETVVVVVTTTPRRGPHHRDNKQHLPADTDVRTATPPGQSEHHRYTEREALAGARRECEAERL